MVLSLFFRLFCFNLIISSFQRDILSEIELVNNYKGVNLAGAEFNRGPGKTYGVDYFYPNTTELDYYASKGFGIIRLPFDLTRVYPIPYAPLSTTELGYMRPIIDYCLLKGMRVIIDPHNGGYIYDNRTGEQREIGVDTEATNMFADFWGKMAIAYKNYSNVVFALINEPHDQTAAQWYTGAVPAIKAIRAVGATQLILIPGTHWTGAWTWVSTGNDLVWNGFTSDPLNNFAFEMHQYLDFDGSGTHNNCVANSSQRLEVATAWLNKNNFKGFLAEFGYTTDPTCAYEGPALMDYLSANSNVWLGWTYWCGGLHVAPDYLFTVEPLSLTPPIDRKSVV